MRLRIVLTSILLLPSGLTVFRQLHLARREAGCLLHGGEHHEGRTAAKEEGCYCQRSTRSFIDSLIENHPQIWRKRRINELVETMIPWAIYGCRYDRRKARTED